MESQLSESEAQGERRQGTPEEQRLCRLHAIGVVVIALADIALYAVPLGWTLTALHLIVWNKGLLELSVWAQRLTVAVYAALIVLWVGVGLSFTYLPASYTFADSYATGFPIREVDLYEAHGRVVIQPDGSAVRLPNDPMRLGSGVPIMFANFGLLFVVALWPASKLQVRNLATAQHVLIGVAMLSLVAGFRWAIG